MTQDAVGYACHLHVICMSCRFMFGSFWIISNVIFCPGSCRWQSFQHSFHTRSCNGLRRSETPVAETLEHEITLIIKKHRTCKRFTSLDKELYWINGLYIFIQLDKNYTRHTDTDTLTLQPPQSGVLLGTGICWFCFLHIYSIFIACYLELLCARGTVPWKIRYHGLPMNIVSVCISPVLPKGTGMCGCILKSPTWSLFKCISKRAVWKWAGFLGKRQVRRQRRLKDTKNNDIIDF